MSLLAHYMRCVEQQRTKYVSRRDQALRNISPIKFSTDLRLLIPPHLLEEIRNVSWLDMELLKFGRTLFAKQQVKGIVFNGRQKRGCGGLWWWHLSSSDYGSPRRPWSGVSELRPLVRRRPSTRTSWTR